MQFPCLGCITNRKSGNLQSKVLLCLSRSLNVENLETVEIVAVDLHLYVFEMLLASAVKP